MVFPNPATGKITIEIYDVTSENIMEILTIEGQKVLSRTLTDHKTQLDISNFPAGIYFVRVTNDKAVMVGKIIKQ